MNDLYLSRVMLRREPSIDALVRQLLPDDRGDRAHAAHRLVWSLFAGDTSRKRDFLFREMEPGKGISGSRTSFLVLSHGIPDADHRLLDVESKPFAPALSKGDRLGFSLRANPVQQSGAKKKDGVRIEGSKTRRRDVVMDALHSVARGGDRIKQRPLLIQQAGYPASACWHNLRRQTRTMSRMMTAPCCASTATSNCGLPNSAGTGVFRFWTMTVCSRSPNPICL
jgi:CRISPR system Cascade subunit CasE